MPNDNKPTIVITGATGLIGSRLCRRLNSAFDVVAVDVERPSDETPGTWMECDLTEDASVERVFAQLRRERGNHLASVVHLAAYYDFSGEESSLYEKLTVEGTHRLIRALQEFQTDQLIFSSSLLVMQPVEEGQVIVEGSPTEAEWAYPESKLEAEEVLRQEHGDIPVAVLRIAGVYDEYGHSLPIGQQIKRIREKQLESFLFPGDADHGQPFVHLDDLVACFEKTIARRHELEPFEVFLIAEPDVMSQDELQEKLGELIHGEAWPTIRIPKVAAKAGAWVKEKLLRQDTFIKPWMVDLADDHYPVAIGKAANRLGWQPTHKLRDTLPEMIDRLKRDPRRWYEINGLPLPESLERDRAVG